jgi:hypothetical protein
MFLIKVNILLVNVDTLIELFEKPWFLVVKKMCWWVALELFFVYNELKTTNSP